MSNRTTTDSTGGDPAFYPLVFTLTVLLPAQVHTKRLLVVFLTWVAYEMIITFDESVELFWKQKWSVSKILFLVNRYDSVAVILWYTIQLFVVNPSPGYCKASFWIALPAAFTVVTILMVALVMRVRALWYRSWLVRYVSWIFFSINVVSYICVLSYMYATSLIAPNIPPLTGCLILPTFRKGWIALVTCIVFETCIIILTVIKSYPQARQLSGNSKNVISTLLLTDGLAYYFTIIAYQVFAIIVEIVADLSVSIPVLSSSPGLVVIAVSCNRLLIRLQRNLLKKEVNMDTTAGITMSGETETETCGYEIDTLGHRCRHRV